jgi:hypothetical protein
VKTFNSTLRASRVEKKTMGIKALSLTAIEKFVSPHDPGYEAVLKNQAELDAWLKSKAKNKGPQPELVYAHSPDATVWHLGTLSSLLMSVLQDDVASFREEGAMTIRMADNDLLAARLALRGWDNFEDDDGNPVPFTTELINLRGRKYEALSEELTSRIPIPVLRSIGQHAKLQNSLTSIQAKNSVSASSPSTSTESETAAPAL